MNSWMGAFFFLIVGVGSKQFRSVITGSVMKKVCDIYENSELSYFQKVILVINLNSILIYFQKQQLIDGKATLQKS